MNGNLEKSASITGFVTMCWPSMSRISSRESSPFRVFFSSLENSSNFFRDASFAGSSKTDLMCLTCSSQILPTSSAQSLHSFRFPTFFTILALISSSNMESLPNGRASCEFGTSFPPRGGFLLFGLFLPSPPPEELCLVNFLSVRQITSSFSELTVFSCPSTMDPKSSSIDFKALKTCQTVSKSLLLSNTESAGIPAGVTIGIMT